ncbi:MAG: peptidoglycan-associated lipoprotein Pal [Acidobacteria bacterium]|nr:peptidoglycan-associated lipoprotein Pal [Acidobacteriota bacterium]
MSRQQLFIMFVVLSLTGAACRKRVAVAPTPAPAVETPPPTELPAPAITLTADRTSIEEGDTVTLEWKSEHAESVRINEIGEVDASGRTQVSPRVATTYTATATGPGGVATDTVRITVTARPAPSSPPGSAPDVSLVEDFRANIEDILFDYDRADLRPDQRPHIGTLARWLQRYSQTRILIEGHCDERGSSEYNLALGDRRASTVKEYLVGAGISSDRINIVSYGELRPVCSEENEACWSRNRRAHFVLADDTR